MNIQYNSSVLRNRSTLGADSWAQNDSFIQEMRNFHYYTSEDDKLSALTRIMPSTLEFSPNLICNMLCWQCPYRMAKKETGCLRKIKRGEFVTSDDIIASKLDTAKIVLEKSKIAGVKGVLWTGGGEPTILESLSDMINYSAELNLVNGLYTNGIQIGMHPQLAHTFLEPAKNMVFIRVSLNAVSPEIAFKFSRSSVKDVNAQIQGLDALLDAREKLIKEYEEIEKHIPSIMVSIIINKTNVCDLSNICKTISCIYNKYPSRYNDSVIIRPLTVHCRKNGYSIKDHDDKVINEILHVVGKNGSGREIIIDAGLKLALGFRLNLIDNGEYNTYEEIIREEYDQRDYCYANGLFLTVSQTGKVHLCVDRNCYKKYVIGDLKNQDVKEIYSSKERINMLRYVHRFNCGPKVCEATCRVIRLNRIARAIINGTLTDSEIISIRNDSLCAPPLLLS